MLVLCPTALAAPVTVQLRVEGATSTIYEGPVTTDGKTVAKDASGPHRCDGTNGGANPSAGPTLTSALDDGQAAGGYTWAGTWFAGFGDFGVDRVGPDTATAERFWGYAVNFADAQSGGCQIRVASEDQVLFGYDYFAKDHLLRLTGPATATTGQPVRVAVVDGRGGAAIDGATVGGATTAADGGATVCFDTPGTRRLKAERADSLRSNALVIAVAAGAGSCSGSVVVGTSPTPIAAAPTPVTPAAPRPATPRAAPTLRLFSPSARAAYRRGPRVISGRVSADGVRQVYLRIRRIARGGCSYYSGSRERFTRPRTCARARFVRVGGRAAFSYLLPERLKRGRYIVDVKAVDRSGAAVRQRLRFTVTR